MRFPQELFPDVIVYFKQLRRKGIKSIYLTGESGLEPAGARSVKTDEVSEDDDMKAVTDAAASLGRLGKKVAVCTECALSGTRTNTVFGAGDPKTKVMFVGEAPGRDEDLKGEPFVGRAGQLLNKILAAIELKREEVYITNILKCRPPQNRDPQESEIRCCEEYLKKQIELIRPKVVCALGRIAAQWLLQTNAPLGTLRTGEYYYEGIPVLPTYHPAALLRNPAFKKPTWEDFKKLKAMLAED